MRESTHLPQDSGDARRWQVLAQFMLCTALNSCQWTLFAGIAHSAEHAFRLAAHDVNVLGALFLIVFVVGGPTVGTAALQARGLRAAVRAASVCNLVATACRLVAVVIGLHGRVVYAAFVLAQMIAATGQWFLLNAPSHLSALWFPASERTVATTLAVAGMTLGAGSGLLIPPLFVESSAHHNRLHEDFIALFGFFFTLCVLDYWFARVATPIAPSALAQERVKIQRDDGTESLDEDELRTLAFGLDNEPNRPSSTSLPAICHAAMLGWKKMYRLLHHSSDFRFLVVAFALIMGTVSAMASLSAQLFSVYRVSGAVSGALSLCGLGCGTVLGMVLARQIDEHKNYWRVFSGLAMALWVSSCALFIVLYAVPEGARVDLRILGSSWIVLVAVETALLPIGLEFAAAVTRPVHAAVSCGTLMVSGTALAVLLTFLFEYLLGGRPSRHGVHGFMLMVVIVLTVAVDAAYAVVHRVAASEPTRVQEAKRKMNDSEEKTPLLAKMAGLETAV